MAREYSYKNQVIVITGGSGGIGKILALGFAKTKAKVIILGKRRAKLKSVSKEIGKFGICGFMPCDVSNYSQVKAVFAKILKKYKKIDVLVNCAGIYGPIGEFHRNNLLEWKEALDVNLLGTVNTTNNVLPHMIKSRRGKVINFSGGGAVQPFPNFSAYATTKAAVVRFTETLANEYAKYNIQVNVIAPGAINTSFLDKVLKAGAERAGKSFFQKSLEQKRNGGDSPYIAAELALFLCSPKNKLTGKLIAAKWDPWKKFTSKGINRLNKTSEYTLRRIDNKYFYAK